MLWHLSVLSPVPVQPPIADEERSRTSEAVARRNLSRRFRFGCKEREKQKADPAMTEGNGQAPPPYPAEKARGGEIILRTPLRRAIFMGGLAGAVALGLLLAFAH